MRVKRNRAPTGKRASGTTVDEYLAGLPEDQQAALQRLRETIKAAAPMATEVISYAIPAYKLNGMLVSFSAARSHCTFHVMSPATFRAHALDLKGYQTTTSGIHFGPDKPLPPALVTKLVKARIAENELRAKK